MHSGLPGPIVRRTTEFDLLVEDRLRRLRHDLEQARSRLADPDEIEILDHLFQVVGSLGETLGRR